MHRNWQWSGNKVLVFASMVGLILFLFIQVLPMATESRTRISRETAEEKALLIAENNFGLRQVEVKVEITHMSDSAAVGYFNKEELLNSYKKEWSDNYPTDLYRADIHLPDGRGTLILFLHMESGNLIGWRNDADTQTTEKVPQETPIQLAERALNYVELWGERPDDWKWDGQPTDKEGQVTFLSYKGSLGEAQLELKVRVPTVYSQTSSKSPSWIGGLITYDIQVPDSFSVYLAEQRSLAGKLNAFGFVVPQMVFLLMAIVYSVSRKEYTTFKRGIWLSLTFLILYAVFYFNLIPGLRAGLLEEGFSANSKAINSLLTTNFIVLVGMALYTYLAAVGGDGLWRSMGHNLWPKWREEGFGPAVLSSMKIGYLLAFLLLGVQSVILVGLQYGIGMFQASDASQSTYNMTISWLLLLLAWCSGISEEIQSRFFGIGLFRSWLLNGAGRVLGQKPSARTTLSMTVLAMIPPGLIWAFGHVGYAVYPIYSRLIELIIMGLLLGWFMLRFGLIAVIFAHVILNSILMSVQIIFDGLSVNLLASLIGFFLPAALGYAFWWVYDKLSGRIA